MLSQSQDAPPFTLYTMIFLSVFCLLLITSVPVIAITLYGEMLFRKGKIYDAPLYRILRYRLQSNYKQCVSQFNFNAADVWHQNNQACRMTTPRAGVGTLCFTWRSKVMLATNLTNQFNLRFPLRIVRTNFWVMDFCTLDTTVLTWVSEVRGIVAKFLAAMVACLGNEFAFAWPVYRSINTCTRTKADSRSTSGSPGKFFTTMFADTYLTWCYNFISCCLPSTSCRAETQEARCLASKFFAAMLTRPFFVLLRCDSFARHCTESLIGAWMICKFRTALLTDMSNTYFALRNIPSATAIVFTKKGICFCSPGGHTKWLETLFAGEYDRLIVHRNFPFLCRSGAVTAAPGLVLSLSP